MIVDFHTHIWPDKISGKVKQTLETAYNEQWQGKGDLEGLKTTMSEGSVDYSVVLPVVTKLSQFPSVLSYAKEINGKDGIISFGGIHPKSENYKEELKQIKEAGLKGIKLHPDFQKAFVDEIETVRLVDYALELGLIVSFHAGFDPSIPDTTYCTADRARRLVKQVEAGYGTIILAHMGSNMMDKDVDKYLLDLPVYFDTAYCLDFLSDKRFVELARGHGIDKILFATDSPWRSQKKFVDRIKQMPLETEEVDKILGGNATRILGLS
ncbi:Amidohydrolase 2 [Lachnospiraceae bacterium TWA4]|nr:Amidohydrolase 2 [Lachnospiraceae bacterium TWA4]